MHQPHTLKPGEWPPQDVVAGIRSSLQGRSAEVGLVLGSGLGSVADALEDPLVIEAAEIAGYPVSTVAGHAGRLILGKLGGRETWVVQGRVHLYEGHTPEVVTRPVRLLHALGVRTVVLTNAAGSVKGEDAGPGDLVAASDAISLFFMPLVSSASPPMAPSSHGGQTSVPECPGKTPPASAQSVPEADRTMAGTGREARRPQHSLWRSHGSVVDPALFRLAQETALKAGISLRPGVLIGSLGPNYETAAEVRAWRRIGGTVASMSTVPEAIEARRLGMRCMLFSLVTNHATGIGSERLTHEDVVRMAEEAGGRLARLLAAYVPRLP